MDAKYWRPLSEGRVGCELCPHRCILGEGKSGICGARKNAGGRMIIPSWGVVSALALDPIEKKPLFHFLPGTKVFSLGFFGCNLACPFCQNWRISQEYDPIREGRILDPPALIRAALESGAPSLAFTYSEPTIHIEYLLEAADLARKAGLSTVLVTNGDILEGPATDLLPLMDAVNVDLKTWSEVAYRETLKGDRATVTAFIALAARACHLEVTTLVVPGISEAEEGISGIAAFLSELDPDIPLHLSAYHPDWRWNRPPLPALRLQDLAAAASRHLRYVYLGNLGGLAERSLCPGCGSLLVERRGFWTRIAGLKPGRALASGLVRGLCAHCGREVPFVLPAPGGKT